MVVIAPQYSFTRPADTTAYGAGDLIANSTTAGSVVPLKFSLNGVGRSGIIRRVRLYKSTTTATQASFTLNLFTSEPTVANGDNGALSVSANVSSWIGRVAVDMTSTGEAGASAGLIQVSSNVEIGVSLPNTGGTIYGLLEAVGTYTPASAESFTAWLEIEG